MLPALERALPLTVKEVEVAPTQPLTNKILAFEEADEFDLLQADMASRAQPANR